MKLTEHHFVLSISPDDFIYWIREHYRDGKIGHYWGGKLHLYMQIKTVSVRSEIIRALLE